MKPPGARLRAIAARLCCADTMERLVDPTLADLQTEYENAARRNRTCESRRILVLGHVAVVRVMAVHGGMQAMEFVRCRTAEDRRTLIRTVGASAAIVIVGTVVLIIPYHAFRVSMSGHPLQKGANELTLGELRELLEPGTGEQTPLVAPVDRRNLALSYHGRWSLAGAPLVLAFFALSVTARRQSGRIVPLLAGCLAICGYYVLMYSARQLGLDHTLSPFAAAWTPNVALLIVSVVVILLGATRERISPA